MAHRQTLIVIKSNRIYPQSKMHSRHKKKNNSVITICCFSIFPVHVRKYYQFEKHLEKTQTQDKDVKCKDCWLEGALRAFGLEKEQKSCYNYCDFCQESRCSFLVNLDQFVAHSNYRQTLPDNNMKMPEKKQVRYTVGALGLGVLIYGLYRLYKYINSPEHQPSGISSSYDNEADISKQNSSFISQSNEHSPYEMLIEDAERNKLGRGAIRICPYLRQISYKIILSLMKGNSYQGIVIMSFFLQNLPEGQEHLKITFKGSGVKYLMVNGKVIDPQDVKYAHHVILIPKEMVNQQGKNHIEVIFENFYSFLDQGLATSFMIDQNQKYSLRQQVIYSINGYLDVDRIIPCFNCLNDCKVQLQVIHSDTFEVFSNTSKSLQRLCSAAEYSKYPFLFDLSSSTLNKSFKLTQSTISNYSGIENNLAYSSVNYYNRKKANSHFYKERLPCIHHLFIFSSPVIELQPTVANHPLESEVLLRYFCKQTQTSKLVKNINKIHHYILDIFRRLYAQNVKGHISKIDILIVADRQVEGYFAPGVILLGEQTLKDVNIGIRCFYLIVRAVLGLIHLEKGNKVITLEDTLTLNHIVFQRFQEFRDYLYIKNKKYSRIVQLINDDSKLAYLQANEGHFLKFYSKQLKFIINQDISDKISPQLARLMTFFKPETPEQYWQQFIINFNLISPLITQPLIKLSLRVIPLPQRRIVQQLKICCSNSKYFLSFYSNQQISDNLPKFIEVEAYDLEKRLTQIKVKQKFKDYITEKYEMYLPIRSNNTEAEVQYLDFKHFNETRNFHHYSVLKTEINRILYFGKHFIAPQRIPVNCSIMGWKLLSKLQLYPADEEHYQLIKFLVGV